MDVKVPTGYISTIEGDKGLLEVVSIGDYGRENNIKAVFLGLDKEIHYVKHKNVDLSEKFVITISTQYGCSSNCKFCDCPKIRYKGNVKQLDLLKQINYAIELYPELTYTKRLNIHFARMGEPTYNKDNILYVATQLNTNNIYYSTGLYAEVIHPVISTMLPKYNDTFDFLRQWIYYKNIDKKGDAGLQLSINSTNEKLRSYMFNNLQMKLEDISLMFKLLPYPLGRKYTLNFALADTWELDPIKLRSLFDPEKFMVKITPIHNTQACIDNNIINPTYDKYYELEKTLIDVGFDVIVFIPSKEEDESRITCGNLIIKAN